MAGVSPLGRSTIFPARYPSPIDPRSVLVSNPSHPDCRAIIIVPARDEAVGIVGTLASLARQCGPDGVPLDRRRFEIILLANNCRDETATLARAFARRQPGLALHVVERTLSQAEANVGTARRLLMDEACRRLQANGKPRGVIASTDADTCPELTWLAAILAAIDAGADAVGGRITTAAASRAELDEGARRAHLRDVGYRFLVAEVESLLDPVACDPWPHHYQHFGASLAVTAEAYRRVGGLPRLPALEDVALTMALVLADARVRHSPDVRVITSARTSSRAVRGFATQFREWSAMHAEGVPLLVEAPASVVSRASQRRLLRELWHETRAGGTGSSSLWARIGGLSGLPHGAVADALAAAATVGQLALLVARAQGRRTVFEPLGPPVKIEQATRELRRLLARLRRVEPRLLPLEEVEPVGVRALSAEMAQDVAATAEKFLVDLVTVQRRIIDRRRPVDQQELAAGG